MKYLILLMASFSLSACAGLSSNAATNDEKVQQGLEQGLDLLVDYDRQSWPGPFSWNDEQWLWKKRLNWSRDCDYIGDVETHSIRSNKDFVVVTCVLGAYQPAQYLYLYDHQSKTASLLSLRSAEEDSKKVWGDIEFDKEEKVLTVFSKARGLADCGSYEVYDFKQLISGGPKLVEWRQKDCSDTPSADYIPPEHWPKQTLD
jgi:hypothetical protein